MFKLLIALMRCGIKSRKYQLSENKLEFINDLNNSKYDPNGRIGLLIDKLNNKCIICYEKLIEEDRDGTDCEEERTSQTLILSCDHVFHSDCFKEWYLGSDKCPYCRTEVNL